LQRGEPERNKLLVKILSFARKVEIFLEKRRLKGNTHKVTLYRDVRKYEIITKERIEGKKIKGGKKHWVRLETQGGTCTCQKQ
jgi:hypothetical protein